VSRRVPAVRFGFVLLVVASLAVTAVGALGPDAVSRSELREQADRPYDERTPVVEPTDGTTVVTTSPPESRNGTLVAFDADGRLRYYAEDYDKYFDVDPVPGTADPVVEYTAGTPLDGRQCPHSGVVSCMLVVIERTNLRTGETERIVTRYTRSGIWHDADRINDTHYLVADISQDRVAVVDTERDVTTWAWDAAADYPPESGGFADDWTHMNDVERLPDGRVMVSMRNQDQVAFLNRSGLQPGWTLGSDGDHDTLYEQHNPDYIPAERGGPAVLVADSENSRLVEYQRRNGSWERSWSWADEDLTWPRDADRLPDGRTLAVDSNGDRVLEIGPDGNVTWSAGIGIPYDAERLGTGDESAGGPAAAEAGLTGTDAGPSVTDRASERTTPAEYADLAVRTVVPSLLVHGTLFVLPPQATPATLLGLAGFLLFGGAWLVAELRWSDRIQFRTPVKLER
jgi:hypothetical protein